MVIMEMGAAVAIVMTVMILIIEVNSDVDAIAYLIREGSGEVRLVIKTPRQHFLAEGDDIGGIVQFPSLMCPHVAGGVKPGLHFIHDEHNAVPEQKQRELHRNGTLDGQAEW
jgi:hypothetical protein